MHSRSKIAYLSVSSQCQKYSAEIVPNNSCPDSDIIRHNNSAFLVNTASAQSAESFILPGTEQQYSTPRYQRRGKSRAISRVYYQLINLDAIDPKISNCKYVEQ